MRACRTVGARVGERDRDAADDDERAHEVQRVVARLEHKVGEQHRDRDHALRQQVHHVGRNVARREENHVERRRVDHRDQQVPQEQVPVQHTRPLAGAHFIIQDEREKDDA